MDYIFSFLKSSVTVMIPLFFASLGGLFPALSGNLNIALEGMLLFSAFSSIVVYFFTNNIILAVFSAVFAALILSILYLFSVFKLKANLFISGLAVNLFSGGICIILSEKIFNTKGVFAVNIDQLNLNWFILTAVILLLISWITIYKTPFGYRLRACEKSSESLKSLGINPQFYQLIAFIICGIFCGIGGAFLSLNLGAFVPGMSAGKGWIALVIIFFGMKKPFGIAAAAFVFSFAEVLSNYAQILTIPAEILLAFPYICTFFAIIIVSILSKKTT
ncbi:MAG: ABC transporter permease [Treponema sp.]|nr:ABC transporter permease [Treponema sp.]